MRPLSLHHLIAPDISPLALVEIAASLDCPHVCLFTQDPGGGFGFPFVSDADLPALTSAMRGHGVSAHGAASFAVEPATDVASYEAALARGAELGATRANARVLDAHVARATESFGRFAALADQYGIVAGIEFTGYGDAGALSRARRIIRDAGAGGIALDALHVVRTATPLEELQSLRADEITYLQLCDGPANATAEDYAREGAFDRLAPGAGEFPLALILGLTWPGQTVSLEVPTRSAAMRGVPAATRCAEIVAATRTFLALAEPDGHG
jgi:hypothetical protein